MMNCNQCCGVETLDTVGFKLFDDAVKSVSSYLACKTKWQAQLTASKVQQLSYGCIEKEWEFHMKSFFTTRSVLIMDVDTRRRVFKRDGVL